MLLLFPFFSQLPHISLHCIFGQHIRFFREWLQHPSTGTQAACSGFSGQLFALFFKNLFLVSFGGELDFGIRSVGFDLFEAFFCILVYLSSFGYRERRPTFRPVACIFSFYDFWLWWFLKYPKYHTAQTRYPAHPIITSQTPENDSIIAPYSADAATNPSCVIANRHVWNMLIRSDDTLW